MRKAFNKSLLILCCLLPLTVYAQQEGVVLGGVEQVYLPTLKFKALARIDTGAATSSLDARNIELTRLDGEDWVSFSLPNQNGQAYRYPLVRIARVRQAASSEPQLRPVIKLPIHLAGQLHEAEFSLTNRSHLNYPLLIGRSVLINLNALVDVNQQYLWPLAD